VKGKTVALVRNVGALEEDCRKADIVIAPFKVGKACARPPNAPRVIVDRDMLQKSGARTLYLDGSSIRTETVATRRGNRPWSRPATSPTTHTNHAGRKANPTPGHGK